MILYGRLRSVMDFSLPFVTFTRAGQRSDCTIRPMTNIGPSSPNECRIIGRKRWPIIVSAAQNGDREYTVPTGQRKLEKSGNSSGQGKVRGKYFFWKSQGKGKSGASRCQILRLKCIKFNFRWSSAPDPARGAYSAPPGPLAALNIAP